MLGMLCKLQQACDKPESSTSSASLSASSSGNSSGNRSAQRKWNSAVSATHSRSKRRGNGSRAVLSDWCSCAQLGHKRWASRCKQRPASRCHQVRPHHAVAGGPSRPGP